MQTLDILTKSFGHSHPAYKSNSAEDCFFIHAQNEVTIALTPSSHIVSCIDNVNLMQATHVQLPTWKLELIVSVSIINIDKTIMSEFYKIETDTYWT